MEQAEFIYQMKKLDYQILKIKYLLIIRDKEHI